MHWASSLVSRRGRFRDRAFLGFICRIWFRFVWFRSGAYPPAVSSLWVTINDMVNRFSALCTPSTPPLYPHFYTLAVELHTPHSFNSHISYSSHASGQASALYKQNNHRFIIERRGFLRRGR